MKHFCKLALFAFLGMIVMAMNAHAQQAQPTQAPPAPNEGTGNKGRVMALDIPFPVAVLDVGKILHDATAVRDIQAQVTKYGTKFENEIEKERDSIRNANQELARQRTILSPDAFAEKRRQFEQRVVEVQQLVQQRQRELDKSRNEAMVKVNEAYIKIVGHVATSRKLAIILRKDQTVFATKALDVTEEILGLLNKELPKVVVAAPGKQAAKPAKK